MLKYHQFQNTNNNRKIKYENRMPQIESEHRTHVVQGSREGSRSLAEKTKFKKRKKKKKSIMEIRR